MTPSPSAQPDPLSAVLASGAPFALIARDESTVELLTGDVVDAIVRLNALPSGALAVGQTLALPAEYSAGQ